MRIYPDPAGGGSCIILNLAIRIECARIGDMQTITLEEHYAIPAFLEGPGRELKERDREAAALPQDRGCYSPTQSAGRQAPESER